MLGVDADITVENVKVFVSEWICNRFTNKDRKFGNRKKI